MTNRITDRMCELNSRMRVRYGKAYSLFNDTLNTRQYIDNLQSFTEDFNPRTIQALERYVTSKFVR